MKETEPSSGTMRKVETGPRVARVKEMGSYLALVIVPVALAVLAVRVWGGATPGPGVPDPGSAAGATTETTLYRLLLAVAVIVSTAHGLGALAARLGQPRVIGELVAGLLLGPLVLGAVLPEVQGWVFPAQIGPALDVLAQLGVIFFMFLVGLELPLGTLRRDGRSAVVLGHAGIALPFLAGAVLGLTLLERYRPANIGVVPFVLFCGLALSITAFPVLARILAERGLHRTPVGALGLACAGIGDITAWCLLTFVIAEVRSDGAMGAVAGTVALTVLFGLMMAFVVRPLLAGWLRRFADREKAGNLVAMTLLVVILLSAWGTERIGVHAIFGAFVAGAVMPRSSPPVRRFADRLEGLTMWLMLPLFFATVGLKTSVDGLGNAGVWLAGLVILVVAMVTKIVGTAVAGRFVGLERRASWSVGVMMNCRGLTELVVLNIGLSLGVIGPDLFAVLVLMALFTTAMTGPLLSRLRLEPDLAGVAAGGGYGRKGDDRAG
ncbi:cation:proton antiporter [Amycolatopsis anabasis]|uniref:cation:proton antiporter n=1 Tax=Amycolatopsis anabasis TaxID=1840409 RepID=UPI00131AC48E|nr:cation:proton antiporter [Amycolatopsis anabasis]